MSFEHSTFPVNDFERMRIQDILETGYGKKFDQHRAEQLFRRASDVIETKNHLGATAGLAIVGDQVNDDARIMMACGFRDGDTKARDRYTELLSICHEEELANWMSVGVQYENVQALCSSAGLIPLSDSDRVSALVSHLHAPMQPIIFQDTRGKVIVRGEQNPSGLGQYIFAQQE